MSDNIFIITRRQFKDGGIGTKNIVKISIEDCANLWNFWLGLLVTKDSVRKILSEILSEEDRKAEKKNAKKCIEDEGIKKRIEEMIDTTSIGEREDIFNEKNFYDKENKNSAWCVKSEFLKRLFQNLNNNSQNELEIDYLMNLHKVGNDIFVYHHWLDKWLNGKPLEEFLTALCKDVLENNGNSPTVNWLVHDTDLGCSGTDGMIYYEGNIINENNPNFVEKSILYDAEKKNVKPDFQKDIFWIFTHTKGVNGYYDNYILKDISSAYQLFQQVIFSTKKLKHLAQVLKDMGFTEQGTISNENDLKDKLFKPFIDYYNFGVKTNSIGDNVAQLNTDTLTVDNFIKSIDNALKIEER